MAHDSPRNSPMPAIRNRMIIPVQPAAILQPRSPIPTPRNVQNRVSPSPDVRRRTEPSRSRISQSEGVRSDLSPTAQLIHKLFRNRDPKLLPDISEVRPLTPSTSRATRQIPTVHVHDEIYSEIPSAPIPTEVDDGDDSSDYLSINNSSLTINLDNIRTDSATPPPAYSKIFDEDNWKFIYISKSSTVRDIFGNEH